MNVEELIRDTNFENVQNKAMLVGDLIEIEETGIYAGIEQVIVLVETTRRGGKRHFALAVMPKCEDTDRLVENKARVFIEGYIATSFNFNSYMTKHQFVVPNRVVELEKNYEPRDMEDFYLNYTLLNRVVMQGVVHTNPSELYIEKTGLYIYKFKLRYMDVGGREKTVNCDMWETVNDLPDLRKDMNIRVVGGFEIRNEKVLSMMGEKVGNSKDGNRGKETSYKILVQKIFDLNKYPEDVASNLFESKE